MYKIGLQVATRLNIFTHMTNATADSLTNQQKTTRCRRLLEELLECALRRGFHGTAEISVTVQDGTIQNLRGKIEQIEQ